MAPLREVLMSIEAVAPAISGSFAYEGCYRPRGSLTFAERSAWGLRSSGSRLPGSKASAPMQETRASARRSTPVTYAQIGPHPVAHTTDGIENSRQRKPRFRVTCLASTTLRCVKPFDHPRQLAKPKRTGRWYRLSVKIGDGSVTCVGSRGRSFVTGNMRLKAPPR